MVKSFGNARERSGRSTGRQAQMMPMFSSTALQVAASALVYVGSVEFATWMRECSRTMEIKQTLEDGLARGFLIYAM